MIEREEESTFNDRSVLTYVKLLTKCENCAEVFETPEQRAKNGNRISAVLR